ncbi:hypothetical protein AYO47_08480 [Planctomyces sp. SCGC AG-212-M04]|nr:hypothetical protein AYO47_08480 [Planctomyces sp. SCGC AG-212-M04]
MDCVPCGGDRPDRQPSRLESVIPGVAQTLCREVGREKPASEVGTRRDHGLAGMMDGKKPGF